MIGEPETPDAVPLSRGWGSARLLPPGASPPPGALLSRDHRGWSLAWRPPAAADGATFACDVEHRERGLDPLLQALVPAPLDGTRFWVLAELCAKLGRTPILAWLRQWRERGWDLPVAATRGLLLDDGVRVAGFGIALNGHIATFRSFVGALERQAAAPLRAVRDAREGAAA